MFDLIIRNGFVVDPESGFAGKSDVAVEDGRIAEVSESISSKGTEELDASGLTVQPGVIDTHLHLASHPFGMRMAAESGVTTCLEMAGPAPKVFSYMPDAGVGINVAVLTALIPGDNVSGNDPKAAEIDLAMTKAVEDGAFGVKILGGHFPLTPEASAEIIRIAAERGIYAAWHAGTTEAGSNIKGMKEAVELASGHPFHLAHINAYCRGRVNGILDECKEAESLLASHPEIVTESYLSDRNGCPLNFTPDGKPASGILSAQLRFFGFEPSRDGAVAAMKADVLRAIAPRNGTLVLLPPKEGVEAFLSGEAKDGSFGGVNPIIARTFFATAKRADGTFFVDGISTDGGVLPRNVIVRGGCGLMKLGGLSALEFAAKTSLIPARMLKLEKKGRLSAGADADLTLYDPERMTAVHTFVRGEAVLRDGRVNRRGGTALVTEAGLEAVRRMGLRAEVLPGGIPTIDRTFGSLSKNNQ